jgi:hypothetical protein
MSAGELHLLDDQVRVTRGFANGILLSVPAWLTIAAAVRFF